MGQKTLFSQRNIITELGRKRLSLGGESGLYGCISDVMRGLEDAMEGRKHLNRVIEAIGVRRMHSSTEEGENVEDTMNAQTKRPISSRVASHKTINFKCRKLLTNIMSLEILLCHHHTTPCSLPLV